MKKSYWRRNGAPFSLFVVDLTFGILAVATIYGLVTGGAP